VGTTGFTVPVLLLDTDVSENQPDDRRITDHLYGGDDRYRLTQEVVLGVGGVRLLRALGCTGIRTFHLNEGHAALAPLELLRTEDQTDGWHFHPVRNRTVFTTHTPVAAGHDQFDPALASRVLGTFVGRDVLDMLGGRGRLNMTHLALNLSHYVNGVALRHREVSSALFPRYEIHQITNGVHARTWTSPPFTALFDRYIPSWRGDPLMLHNALALPAEDVWQAHQRAKEALIGTVFQRTGRHLRGDALTLGFARRATAYKRPELVLSDLSKLCAIAKARPLLGATAHRIWNAVGVREGLLEQQVSLGWGIVALGLVAICRWTFPGSNGRQPASLLRVPVLVAVALTALLCSLSPDRTIGGFTFVRPSALLYDLAPMFRSYARFGVVVQLMAALLAGIGVDYLRRAGTRRARIVCLALVAIGAFEYAVAPRAQWRDVLPTAAHRWVARQPGQVRALDCMPLNPETASVQWLTGHRVTFLGGWTSDCMEPNLSGKLAAAGYTHLLVRRDTADEHWVLSHPEVDGLRVAAAFDDSRVFAVTARSPTIYTEGMRGFYPRERDAEWTWRWMGHDAAWTIVNTRAQLIVATLGIELSAFHRARRMELLLDGRHVQMFVVEPPRRMYYTRPLAVTPGAHELAFRPAEAPTVADEAIGNGDPRALSFAFGAWAWTVRGEQP